MTLEEKLKFDKSKSLKIKGDFFSIWEVYFFENTYLKDLNFFDINIRRDYFNIIHAIHSNIKHPSIPTIKETYGADDQFLAYRCSAMYGQPLNEFSKAELLQYFPSIISSLKTILKYAEKECLVFLDLFTNGNVLFDSKTKKTSIIDIDSFQVGQYLPPFYHQDLLNSSWDKLLFRTEKYKMNDVYTPDINYFLIYELFFRLFFKQSLLSLPFGHSEMCQLSDDFSDGRDLYTRIEMSMHNGIFSRKIQGSCEKSLVAFLERLGFDKKENIFGRILDLSRNTSNSISTEDFQAIFEKYVILNRNNQIKLVRK